MKQAKRDERIKEMCRILRIKIPRVLFVKNFKDFGCYYRVSQLIIIKEGMDIFDEVSTVAHELKHVQQHMIYKHLLFSYCNKPDWDYETDWFEIEAHKFGIDMLNHFGLYEEDHHGR